MPISDVSLRRVDWLDRGRAGSGGIDCEDTEDSTVLADIRQEGLGRWVLGRGADGRGGRVSGEEVARSG